MIASGVSGIPPQSMYRLSNQGRRPQQDERTCSLTSKLEELLQASTQQQSFLFALQEEVRGLGVQLGDLRGTVSTLQDKIDELQESQSTSNSSDSASTRIPKHVSVSVYQILLCMPLY